MAVEANDRRYILIAPSRDEAATMRRTLDSVLAQTILPELMVFVDDGSTDETQAILNEYKPLMPFLRVLTRTDSGERRLGQGVVEAFNAGLATVDLAGIEFLCKLDMDLELPPRYFELLIARMDADPDLATCSGKAYYVDAQTGRMVPEVLGDQVSAGMTKFYRVSAFRTIGGLPLSLGWDGIDCYLCCMNGMKAASFDDPALGFLHLRPMGSSHVSLWHGRMRHGLGARIIGMRPFFLFVTSIYRLNKRPYVTGSLAILYGYLRAWVSGVKPYPAPGYSRFMRDYQRRALVFGRARASEQMRLRYRADTGGRDSQPALTACE